MAEVGDFVVVNTDPAASEGGKWNSPVFYTGGRNIRKVDDVEVDNAYVILALTSPEGGEDVEIRVIVNHHPLPLLLAVPANSRRTHVVAFPASLLGGSGDANVIGLHSKGEKYFAVIHVICHFRQDT